MADPLLHRSAGAPKPVGIGLEKYVSIKRTAERALGVDRIPLDPGRVIKNALQVRRLPALDRAGAGGTMTRRVDSSPLFDVSAGRGRA